MSGEPLRAAITRLGEVASGDAMLTEEMQDLQTMSALFDDEQVAESDIKYMKQRSYDTSRSRDSSKGRISRTGEG